MRLATDHPKWQEWANRSIAKDIKRYGVRLCLHHYTSFAGFTGIVSNRSVWATDARFLNDRDELTHGLTACDRALSRVRHPALRPHVEVLRQALREQFGMATYVACFSESPSLASQWKSYADGGKGFAIGFDVACLSGLWAGATALRLMPVEYDATVQQERADEVVGDAIADIVALGGDASPDFGCNVQSRFAKLAVDLLYLCATFKSGAWKHEHEWRLLYHQTDGEKGGLSVGRRQSGGIGVPFVRIDLTRTVDDKPRRIFESVREGPLVHPDMSSQVRALVAGEQPPVKWTRQRE